MSFKNPRSAADVNFAVKQRQLFTAIAQKFPLAALSWGKDMGVAFADEDVEAMNICLESIKNANSDDDARETKWEFFGYNRISAAISDVSRARDALDKIMDAETTIIGFLRGAISPQTMQPDYELFLKKVPKGFNLPTGRMPSAINPRPTHLSTLAEAGYIYDELVQKGGYRDKKQLPCGLRFLEKLVESGISKQAEELQEMVTQQNLRRR